MPLPVLNAAGPSREDLVRLFHKCEREYAAGIGEAETLDCGTAVYAPAFPTVWQSNGLYDAALPDDGTDPATCVAAVDAFYRERGLTCHKWTFNPAAPPSRVAPLVDRLVNSGYTTERTDILRLGAVPPVELRALASVQILPARASFRHWRQIAETAAARWGPDGADLAEASVAHLDDPHFDALVAIEHGQAVGRVGVLTVGELGLVEDVDVAPAARRRGIGTALVARAIEIAARGRLRHVMLRTEPDNAPAQRLYAKFGFQRVGEFVQYVRPRAG